MGMGAAKANGRRDTEALKMQKNKKPAPVLVLWGEREEEKKKKRKKRQRDSEGEGRGFNGSRWNRQAGPATPVAGRSAHTYNTYGVQWARATGRELARKEPREGLTRAAPTSSVALASSHGGGMRVGRAWGGSRRRPIAACRALPATR